MKADLHIHSHHSKDGTSSVEEIVKVAKERGMGCIAVADHNDVRAQSFLSDYEGEMIHIPAVEVSTTEGHIIAYGVDEAIPRGLSVKETIAIIHEMGGLACAVHPYRWWSGIGEANVTEDFDLIEARNSRSTKGGNRKAEQLAKRMGKPVTAGSDAHITKHIGDAYLEIPDDCRSAKDVLDAMRFGEGIPRGSHRGKGDTLRYGFKAISEWMGRGFRRM